MEVTQKTKAIILKREAFNESNSRVFVYTQDFGKLDLVARGTNKLSSKLASHIEPLNLCEIMIIKGKQYNYLGSAVSENVFINIKNDYVKCIISGEVAQAVDQIIKGREKDEQIFLMLYRFLEVLNNCGDNILECRLQTMRSAFILKLISMLGYQPDLDNFKVGNILASKNVINIMKFALKNKFEDIAQADFTAELVKEFEQVVKQYKQYIFD
ncbi:MAG: DNA repair protein RecO [Candidatus Falkowbacteria bacterium]